MISHRLWVSRFGGSKDVLAADIRLDTDLHRVVGVMKPGFRALHADDMEGRATGG